MAQFARPSADTYNADGWTEDDGDTTNMYQEIDETSLDDADYIRSALTPTSDVYVCALTSVEDPQSSSGHTVRVRRSKDAAGGDTITLTAELRQGYVDEGSQGTLIATIMSAVTIDETWTTTTYNLSAGEADAITNYASLFLRFVANKP